MSKPLLALCLIVKNEAHTLRRTLDSCASVVDYVSVYDTGSTDGTQNLVRVWGVEHQKNIDLVEGPFENYAFSRNRVLAIATQRSVPAKYALSFSADEMLVQGAALRQFLETYQGEEEAFHVEIRATGGLFDYPRVLKLGSPWKYEGEVHEVPKYLLDPARQPKIKIPGCYIQYSPTDPKRHATRLIEYDLPALSRMLAKAENESDRTRCLLLLAQTHEAIATNLIKNQIAATRHVDEPEAVAHQTQALGYYLYLGQKSDDPNIKFRFLNVISTLGIYTADEMIRRLKQLEIVHPDEPAISYMLSVHAANLDAKAGLNAARRAAKIAEAAVVDKSNPYDPHGLLWRSHYIAALCARALGDAQTVSEHVQKGTQLGAPVGAFQEFAV